VEGVSFALMVVAVLRVMIGESMVEVEMAAMLYRKKLVRD
jgi:hypothetical protein